MNSNQSITQSIIKVAPSYNQHDVMIEQIVQAQNKLNNCLSQVHILFNRFVFLSLTLDDSDGTGNLKGLYIVVPILYNK